MLRLALVSAELSDRIKWLIKLRWLFIIFALITIFTISSVIIIVINPVPLYIVILVLLLSNIFFRYISKKIYFNDINEVQDESKIKKLVKYKNRIVNFQSTFDMFFLSLLIYFSGGIDNPFIFYFIFHMIIASISLKRTAAYIQASIATVFMIIIMISDYYNIIAENYIVRFVPENTFVKNIYFLGTFFVFITTLYFSVFMGTSIAKKLRKREDELIVLQNSLETRAEELNEANIKLRKADKLKSEYVLKVSHELKSPLAAIKSYLRIIIDGYVGEISEKLKEILKRTENRTDELLSLISDLLNLSFLKTGKAYSQPQSILIKEIIISVLNLFSAQAEKKNILIQSDIQSDIQSIIGDKDNVKRLIINLVSNAVKYTPEGGTIKIKAEGKNGGIRIIVSDTGIGISEKDLPIIFKDFFRSKEARAIDRQGTGLGMAIVKQIVKQHHGDIKVFSKLGNGTTFDLLLKNI